MKKVSLEKSRKYILKHIDQKNRESMTDEQINMFIAAWSFVLGYKNLRHRTIFLKGFNMGIEFITTYMNLEDDNCE